MGRVPLDSSLCLLRTPAWYLYRDLIYVCVCVTFVWSVFLLEEGVGVSLASTLEKYVLEFACCYSIWIESDFKASRTSVKMHWGCVLHRNWYFGCHKMTPDNFDVVHPFGWFFGQPSREKTLLRSAPKTKGRYQIRCIVCTTLSNYWTVAEHIVHWICMYYIQTYIYIYDMIYTHNSPASGASEGVKARPAPWDLQHGPPTPLAPTQMMSLAEDLSPQRVHPRMGTRGFQ